MGNIADANDLAEFAGISAVYDFQQSLVWHIHGITAHMAYDLESAEMLFRKCLEARVASGKVSPTGVNLVRLSLTRLLLDRRQFREVIDMLNTAYPKDHHNSRFSSAQEQLIAVEHQLALAWLGAGNAEYCPNSFSLADSHRLPLSPDIGFPLFVHGTYWERMGELNKSLEDHRECLKTRQELDTQPLLVAASLFKVAGLENQKRNPSRALPLLYQCYDLYTKLSQSDQYGDRHKAYALRGKARCAWRLHELSAGEEKRRYRNEAIQLRNSIEFPHKDDLNSEDFDKLLVWTETLE